MLRRSFSLLGESAGAPARAIAQVMGHKPSATAEGYRPRSVDALRPYLEKIEAHILAQAGIVFDAQAESGKLRVVAQQYFLRYHHGSPNLHRQTGGTAVDCVA